MSGVTRFALDTSSQGESRSPLPLGFEDRGPGFLARSLPRFLAGDPRPQIDHSRALQPVLPRSPSACTEGVRALPLPWAPSHPCRSEPATPGTEP